MPTLKEAIFAVVIALASGSGGFAFGSRGDFSEEDERVFNRLESVHACQRRVARQLMVERSPDEAKVLGIRYMLCELQD